MKTEKEMHLKLTELRQVLIDTSRPQKIEEVFNARGAVDVLEWALRD